MIAVAAWVGVTSAASIFALARGGRVAPPVAFLCWVFALVAIGEAITSPRLVGYGCEGSTAPIYADEEDQFPRCDRIEAN